MMCVNGEAQGMGIEMTDRYVVFSHGRDSEPWGSKIAAMAEIAREEGYTVESVDYRGNDDPKERMARLLAFCKDDVIPVENSFRFAREQKATLHVLDSDHRLLDQIRAINHYFAYFLFSIDELAK
jgi:hypothetical protein